MGGIYTAVMLVSSLSFRRAPQWMEDAVAVKSTDLKTDESMTLKEAMKTNEFYYM
jgi:hypothetical protein